jgi:Tol biopolymer transport system component
MCASLVALGSGSAAKHGAGALVDCNCKGGSRTSPGRSIDGNGTRAAAIAPAVPAPAPVGGAAAPARFPTLAATDQNILKPEEQRFLGNVRQLTFGQPAGSPAEASAANYAEAYWAPDGRSLTLQATRGDYACDQIFQLDLATNELRLVSTGTGRTTCSYFTGDGAHILFSSTHDALGAACPANPDMSHGYVWPVYNYDIYLRGLGPDAPLKRLTDDPAYDAESTIDWHTGWVYFTSSRDGDLDIYRMQLDSAGNAGPAQRLTDSVGYDGGPFVSYDGRTVLYRRDNQATPEQRAAFKALLAQGLVKPTQLEIWAMSADGSGKRQLTSNGQANFAPFLHPDNRTVIFCSNSADSEKHRKFELWALPLDGSHAPVRITHGEEFDGFPMFSPDGTKLVWCSNRNHAVARETNVFMADWKGIAWDNE